MVKPENRVRKEGGTACPTSSSLPLCGGRRRAGGRPDWEMGGWGTRGKATGAPPEPGTRNPLLQGPGGSRRARWGPRSLFALLLYLRRLPGQVPLWPVKVSVPREAELCRRARAPTLLSRSQPERRRLPLSFGANGSQAGRGLGSQRVRVPSPVRCLPACALPPRSAWANGEHSTASQYMNVYFIRTDTDHDI